MACSAAVEPGSAVGGPATQALAAATEVRGMAVAERSATVSILRVPGVPGVELTEIVGAEIPRAPRVVSAYELAICQEGEIQFFRRGRIRAFTPGLISLAEPGEVVRVFRASG